MSFFTKVREKLSSRGSKRYNSSGLAKGKSGRNQQQTPDQVDASASNTTTCVVPADSTGVFMPSSAPSGSSPHQACPPEQPNESSSATHEDDRTPICELWNVAYERLRDEDRDLVADYEAKLCGDVSAGLSSTFSSKIGMRNRMDTILRRKMVEVNQNTWKLKFGTSEVQVKDLVEPILGVVDWVNDYITDAVSTNVYASLAWGGVSLLLPLFLNPSEQAASMAKGLEYISSLIVQSRMWEELYSRRYEATTDQHVPHPICHTEYKVALEMLYRQVLKLQVTAHCYYAKEGAFRLGRDMIKWDDWDELLDKVKEQERVFSAISSSWRDMKYDEECSAAKKRHQDVMSCWQTIGTGTSGLLKAVQDAQAEKHRDGFLTWLCSIDHSVMYNIARDQHMDGTSDWLVRSSEEFKVWKTSPSSLLWLYGKAGSGKSILSSSVVEHLKHQCKSEPGIALAYFFLSFSDLERQNLAGMLSSIIKQLYCCRPDTPPPVKSLQESKRQGERPDTKALEAALVASARGFSAVFIVIDALDECPTIGGQRKNLLNSFSRIVAKMPDNVHIFCTSRPEQDVQKSMTAMMSSPSRIAMDLTEIHHGLDHDINLYIDSMLETSDCSDWPSELKTEAKLSLIKNADGMFRYIICQFEILQKLSSIGLVRKALQDLPVGLDATYDRLLQNIDPDFQAQVTSLLKWLASSTRVLRLSELADIFATHPGRDIAFDEDERLIKPENVLKYISSLVITQGPIGEGVGSHDPPTVRLAHFTIKEYLMSDRIAQGPARSFSFDETNANLHIAHWCLAYHLQAVDTSWSVVHFSPTLNRYAVTRWALHLEMVPREAWSPDVERLASRALAVRSKSLVMLVKVLLDSPGFRERYVPGWGKYDRYDLSQQDELTSLIRRPQSYTARRGLYHLTVFCESLSTNSYLTQGDLDECLWNAADGGNVRIVQHFLERGANVNAINIMGTALDVATQANNTDMVRLLLEADVNEQNKASALHAAAGIANLQLMQLLVEHGADVNLPSRRGCTITAAVGSNQGECLRFLLDNGASINQHHDSGGTALHKAARHLPRAIADLDLLLERGADVNVQSGEYGYPLQAACTTYAATGADIERLLSMGADVNAQGGKYDTALQAECGHKKCWDRGPDWEYAPGTKSIIDVLLESGADVNLLGGYWGTALGAACSPEDRRPDIVKRLLQEGADVNIQGGHHGSALQVACAWSSSSEDRNDQAEIVELLLSRGGDVNMQGGEYGTALQAACLTGRHHIVSLLIQHGADVNIKGGSYGTALQAACYMGYIDFARLLIQHGAEVNIKGGIFGSALQAACYMGDIRTARFLIEKGAEVNIEGGEYGTALQAACSGPQNVELVRLLIEHGADVYVQGVMAWNLAINKYQFPKEGWQMLQLLLDYGVDFNDTTGMEQRDALRAVIECKTLEGEQLIRAVRFLLDHGADINLRAGKYGFTLQSACAFEYSLLSQWYYPIEYACERAMLLLEYCPTVDVNAEGGVYGFALQAAAYSGQTGSVKVLLDKGADINARGGKYHSALNAAVFRGNWDIVEMLLERGATPDSQQLLEADESWLARIQEEDGGMWGIVDVERYKKFWDVWA